MTAALCFAAMWLAGPDAAPAQQGGIGLQIPSQRALARYGLERAWWGQASLNPKRDTVRYLTVDEENIYVQATSGVITAFNNETGKRLWAIQLGRPDQFSYPLVSNEGHALVAVSMTMYALNKFTGELLWQIDLPAHPSTSPTIDAERVYIGTLDGSVYAYSLEKIHELYNENRLPQWSYETQVWRYQTGAEVTTPPISTGRTVEFASRDKSLYSVTAERRELIFQFETDAATSASMVRSGERLYMASEDFNFYCLNSENGTVLWEFIAGQPIRQAPVIVGSQIFLLPDRGGMYCLAKDSGDQNWWRPRGTQFLAATHKLVFMSDRSGNIVIVDRKVGAPIGALPMRDFDVRLSNARTDRMYVATESGLVICIRDRNQEFPLYHKYPERRPIIPIFADEGQPAAPAGEAPAGDTPADPAANQ